MGVGRRTGNARTLRLIDDQLPLLGGNGLHHKWAGQCHARQANEFMHQISPFEKHMKTTCAPPQTALLLVVPGQGQATQGLADAAELALVLAI